MKAYLQLTLARAEEIVGRGERQWWAEARLAVHLLGKANPPGQFLYCTFVKATKAQMNVKAGVAQCIVVFGLRGASLRNMGTPLVEEEPCVLLARRIQILASVVEIPQGSREARVEQELSLGMTPRGKQRKDKQ